ncbi:MAG: biopolymer transporter ExbD [Gammaproteobacteria bacterium]|nr:biopolymer transporter ExbD [Gammaproteobacteria bacterium]
MKLVRRKMVQDVVELNITAFLNLMVILVPFLLITAVFSRITILELNLPPKNARAVEGDQVKLQLELVIRPDSFEIRDSNFGRIRFLPRNSVQTDWNSFTNLLVEIKTRFPDEKNITLLIDKQVSYKTIIAAMDRVSSAEIVNVSELEVVELFPNISMGDAPPLNGESTRQSDSTVEQGQEQ